MHVLAGFLMFIALAGAKEDKFLETIKVAENIYVFKPTIDWSHGNGVAIIGPDGVFFIDTYIQFNYAEEAIRRLKKLTRLPVKYVLNTHWHNDHVTGNGVFRRHYPDSRFIMHDSTFAYMDTIIKPQIAAEGDNIQAALAQLSKELQDGKRSNGQVMTEPMKAFWAEQIANTKDYARVYRPEKFVNGDITFSDSMTLRWGAYTLKLFHLGQSAHSEGDVAVWIPENRLLVAGDIVVGPTPYATQDNSSGMVPALQAIIAMNPAIIIPGHGVIQHDLTYVKLLEQAFSAYRKAADAAVAAKMPLRQALDSTSFPEIDRQFIGDDGLKKWAYQAFFSRLLIYNTYKAAGALPAPPRNQR